MLELNKIYNKNCLDGLKQLNDNSIDCCISSPPYWALRSYLGEDDINKKFELGQESSFRDYINNLSEIYKEVHRVLKPTGTCFVNLGDTYYGGMKGAGGIGNTSRKQVTNKGSYFGITGHKFNNKELKNKCLCNIPARFAIKMTDEIGFIERNLIIWHRPNQMPHSCKDRFTVDFEYIYFFTKNQKYYFEQQFEPLISNGMGTVMNKKPGQKWTNTIYSPISGKINPKGRNARTVWSINTVASRDEHYAMYPEELVKRMILAGCPENGIVLDPFMGAGTTALVSKKLNRNFIGFELNEDYCNIAQNRLNSSLL